METSRKDVLNSLKIVNVIRRTLGYIDTRLVDHGERVAFIANRIMQALPPQEQLDTDKLFMLSVLHDIGAYKTEEIDNMVMFETKDVANHAIFGYLFLRNTTGLGEYAQAILYHHTDYTVLKRMNNPYTVYAALIFLADRIDILLAEGHPANLAELQKLAGSKFSPRLVETFLAAEQEGQISSYLSSGDYKEEVNKIIQNIAFSAEEMMEYLEMLVYAIDFRSPYTVMHTTNTAVISLELGELLGLTDKELQELYSGAFLHDIGKIVVPFKILEKPGRLSPEETVVMREHVVNTRRIIAGFVPDSICEIASRHHEKLNGTGYPEQLTACELTRQQRIVAVADIISALIGRRSYKEPFPKEKVLAIITDMCQKGELCPEVCSVLAANYDKIIQAVEHGQNPVLKLYDNIMSSYEKLKAKVVLEE